MKYQFSHRRFICAQIFTVLLCATFPAIALAIPAPHLIDAKIKPTGTISSCSPAHDVTVELAGAGAGHWDSDTVSYGDWDTSEAADYGCEVEIDSANPTIAHIRQAAGAKLKSGSFTIYYRGGWSGCPIPGHGSGTFEGSVVIDVVGDDDEGGGGGGGGCGTCKDGSFGSASLQNNSVDFRLYLGRAARDGEGNYKHGGYLKLKADSPSASLANLSSLSMPYIRSGVERVPADKNQTIQKVQVPEGLVVMTSVNNGYNMKCYRLTQLGSSGNPIAGVVPFVTWTLINPGADQSKFQVTETRGGQQKTHLYNGSSLFSVEWLGRIGDDA